MVRLPTQLFIRNKELDRKEDKWNVVGYTYKDTVNFVLWISDNHISAKFEREDFFDEMPHEDKRTYFRYIPLNEGGDELSSAEKDKLIELCEYMYTTYYGGK